MTTRTESSRIAIIAAGAWGTALGASLVRGGHKVILYSRRTEVVDEINTRHRNSRYLPGISLPTSLSASGQLEQVVEASDLIVLAVPSRSLRQVCNDLKALPVRKRLDILSTVKGIDKESKCVPSEVIREVLGHLVNRLAVLSGPNFASEVACGLPAGTVIASDDEDFLKHLIDIISTTNILAECSADVKGVQLAGCFKNAIAFLAGVAEGLGLGMNARAFVVEYGFRCMRKVFKRLGLPMTTTVGLAGLGDVVLTATSAQSRNYRAGLMAARSETLKVETLEGIDSVHGLRFLVRDAGCRCPLCLFDLVSKMIEGSLPPTSVMGHLFNGVNNVAAMTKTTLEAE